MKIRYLFFLIISMELVNLQAQSAEKIIQKHLKTINQKQLSQINNQTTTGILYQSGVEVDLKIIHARGFKMRQELTFQEQQHTVVYNDIKGWELNQFAGHTEPQAFEGQRNMAIKISADIDSRIQSFLKLKSSYELKGEEELEGKKHYIIAFDIPNHGIEEVWFDQENLTITKTKESMSGLIKHYGDYKRVNDILLAHELVIKLPQGDAKIKINKFEFDTTIDKTLFQ